MLNASLSTPFEARPIRDIAYENLKRAIVTGELPAGSRIVETTYAVQLHISRTPLREALRKLEQDGLVEYQPHRGVVVRAFTLADVKEIYTIRNALELLTLPAIVENATPEDIAQLREILAQMDPLEQNLDVEQLSPLAREFHTRLTAISGMKRIIAVIQSQDEYIRRFSEVSISHEERRHQAHLEHHQLVNLVEKKDLSGFTTLMKKHIQRSMETCLKALEKSKLKKNG